MNRFKWYTYAYFHVFTWAVVVVNVEQVDCGGAGSHTD